MSCTRKRIALVMTFAVALVPMYGALPGEKKAPEKNEYYKGKVVSLADLLKKENTKIDDDVPMLVLQAEDGKLYPLVKDAGSRMFFKDAKLLNRPMRLTARKLPNSEFLQVISVKSYVKGKLHEPYYWCDICTIKRYEGGACDCCGMPLDFHEDPWKGD